MMVLLLGAALLLASSSSSAATAGGGSEASSTLPPMARSASSSLGGALYYLDFRMPGFNMQLVSLDIASNTTETVLPLGKGESFFAQVSATSADGGMYFTTIQYKNDRSDPKAGDWAQTIGVRLHKDAESQVRRGGSRGAEIVHKLNTSECWNLAVEEPPASSADTGAEEQKPTETLLCLAEGPCKDTPTHVCKPQSATTSLIRIDLAQGVNKTVGRFTEGAICDNQAAAYDAKAGIYYAFVGAGVAAMDVKSGELLWHKPFLVPAGQEYLVHDFAIDSSTGQAYAVCSVLASMAPVTWGSMIATLDLRGGTMAMVPLTQPDVFGTTVSGKCSTPGTSKGAARGCYGQLNDGFIGDGVFFTTAFAAGPPEVVLGVDLKTGQVVFEQGPTDSPVRAALASCPLRCLRNQPCSYGPVQRCCATCPSVVCTSTLRGCLRLLLRTCLGIGSNCFSGAYVCGICREGI
jgi:hypothetical protein